MLLRLRRRPPVLFSPLPSEQSETDHPLDILTVAWKKDKIVTGDIEGRVRVCDAELKVLKTIDSSLLGVVSVDLQGSIVVTSGLDGCLRSWNTDTGDLVQEIQCEDPTSTWKCLFQPHKEGIVATTGSKGEVHVWNVLTGVHAGVLKMPTDDFVTALAFTRDGTRLACGNRSGLVVVFEFPSGKILQTSTPHLTVVRALAFSSDTSTLYSASDDMSAVLVDTKSGESVASLIGHAGAIYTLALSPTGKFIATGGADNKIKIWNTSDRECALTLHHHTAPVNELSWDDKTDKFVSVGEDHTAILYRCLSQ